MLITLLGIEKSKNLEIQHTKKIIAKLLKQQHLYVVLNLLDDKAAKYCKKLVE